MSRIWEPLKQAEQQKSHTGAGAGSSTDRPPNSSERRSEVRQQLNAPVLINGSDAEKRPFHEEGETINANNKGCLLAIETVVAHGQRLFLTNMRTQAKQECKVVHIGKCVDGKTRVGVEFLNPTPNFWRPF